MFKRVEHFCFYISYEFTFILIVLASIFSCPVVIASTSYTVIVFAAVYINFAKPIHLLLSILVWPRGIEPLL
jgi:hypothetical protein